MEESQKGNDAMSRTSVLLNTTEVDLLWIYRALKGMIHPDDRVCVVAMSYFDDTKTPEDWNRQYSPADGCFYKSHSDVFKRYGIDPGNVVWINPFVDDRAAMLSKIDQASILLLPGGAPDLFMKRLKKLRLTGRIRNFDGLVIGCSAGSMMQLEDYHISPDPDYEQFSWQKGAGPLKGFWIEPHFTSSKIQKESIETVLERHQGPVYGIWEDGGLIVDENNQVTCIGRVDYFE